MGFLSKIFGKKPKVPEFVPVDYDKEYDATWDYNEENIERFGGISRKAQEQDQQALTQGLRSAIPNYDELLASEFDITREMLRGTLNEDRWRDRRAALGLSTGTQDSKFTQHQFARDYGLAEMEVQKQGMAYADNRIRRQSAFVAQPVSVTTMFQSPQQRIAQKMSERDSKFNRDFAANKIAAAPDPRWTGMVKVGMAAAGAMTGGASGAAMGAQMGSNIFGGGGGGGGGGVAASLGGIGKAVGGFLGGMGGGGGGFSPATNYSYSASTYGASPVVGPSGGFHQPMWGQGGLAYSTNSYSSGANFGNKLFGM